MFDADPATIATLADHAVRTVMRVGPPADLPAPVPEFVGNLLGEIASSVGEAKAGIGETVRGLTPGGGSGAAPDAAGP